MESKYSRGGGGGGDGSPRGEKVFNRVKLF